MQPGDLIMFTCKDPRDVGVVMRIYENHPDLTQRIDVLWADGVYTQDASDLDVVAPSTCNRTSGVIECA